MGVEWTLHRMPFGYGGPSSSRNVKRNLIQTLGSGNANWKPVQNKALAFVTSERFEFTASPSELGVLRDVALQLCAAPALRPLFHLPRPESLQSDPEPTAPRHP